MKKKFFLIFVVIGIACAVLIFFCVGLFFSRPMASIKNKGPQDGLWYCKELRAQINFDSDYISQNDFDTMTYIVFDNSYLVCDVTCVGSSLKIINQDITSRECGSVVFRGNIVSLDEVTFTVRSEDETEYTFKRIPEFVLDINSITNVELMAETQDPDIAGVGHYEQAIEKAKQLWETEFGTSCALQECDPSVSIDSTLQYWRITQIIYTETGKAELKAVIKRTGEKGLFIQSPVSADGK